ncbi:MAG: HAMP domain-containing sensor histidine kinase [Patescibacteria group bacterium]
MTLPPFTRTIAFRVGFSVAALLIVIFTSLYLVVERRGERAFTDTVTFYNGRFGVVPPFGEPWPMARLNEPRQEFRNRFRASLLLIGALGVLGAAGIGAFVALLITRPLRKVGEGMQKLRASDYHQRLAKEPSDEVNALVTEFNALTDELRRADELRKTMISDVSHELKTPIASLLVQLEGMRDGVIAMDPTRLDGFRVQLERLHDMVEELQAYTRLRSRAVTVVKNIVNLQELAERVVAAHTESLQNAKLTAHVRIPAGQKLDADSLLLERVLENLLVNAARYAKGTRVDVVWRDGNLIVEDDGVGIPAEHVRDVFERFFRLEKSRSRDTGGLGLGLAIVKEIVESHGWSIHAERSQYPTGVAFIIATHRT